MPTFVLHFIFLDLVSVFTYMRIPDSIKTVWYPCTLINPSSRYVQCSRRWNLGYTPSYTHCSYSIEVTHHREACCVQMKTFVLLVSVLGNYELKKKKTQSQAPGLLIFPPMINIYKSYHLVLTCCANTSLNNLHCLHYFTFCSTLRLKTSLKSACVPNTRN